MTIAWQRSTQPFPSHLVSGCLAMLMLSAQALAEPTRQSSNDFADAQRSMWSGDYETAEELLSQVIQASPELPAPYLNRALCRRLNGQYESALADYDACLALAPDSSAALLGKAGVLVELGNADAALEILDQLTAGADSTVQAAARCSRGKLYQRQTRLTEALEEFDAAITHDRFYKPAYAARAACRVAAIEYWWAPESRVTTLDTAIEDFDVAILAFPERVELWLGRAEAKQLAGRAMQDVVAAQTETSYMDENLIEDWSLSFRYSDPDTYFYEALNDFDQAQLLAPDNWSLRLSSAACRREYGMPYSAADELLRVVQADTDLELRLQALRLRLEIHIELGDSVASLQDLERFVELAPADAAIRLEFANTLLNLNLAECALAQYQAYLASGETPDFTTRLWHCYATAQAGDCEHARELYDVLLLDYPSEYVPLCCRGLTHLCRNDAESAISDFEAAAALWATTAEVSPTPPDLAFSQAILAVLSGTSRRAAVSALLAELLSNEGEDAVANALWGEFLVEISGGGPVGVDRLWPFHYGERELERLIVRAASEERAGNVVEALRLYRAAAVQGSDSWFVLGLANSKCRTLAMEMELQKEFGAELLRLDAAGALSLERGIFGAAVVENVTRDGLAARLQLQDGDVLLAVDDMPIDVRFCWVDLVLAASDGRISLELERDGDRMTLETAIEPQDVSTVDEPARRSTVRRLGGVIAQPCQ